MFKDELGDRIKFYESYPLKNLVEPPFVVRLDGRNFRKWTKGLAKPYDVRLIELFEKCTLALLKETGADFGYHQSDEITLGFLKPKEKAKQLYFGGKVQKIISVTSSFLTSYFNNLSPEYFEKKPLALFDSRLFEVPNKSELVNTLIWRQQDAKRNSIQLLGRSQYSHKLMQNKSSKEIRDLLKKKKIEWDDELEAFKYGQLFRKVKKTHKFTAEELDKLPPQHHARTNPNLVIERNSIERVTNPFYKNRSDLFQVLTDASYDSKSLGKFYYRQDWQYTPYLDEEELKEGEKVQLLLNNQLFEGTIKIVQKDKEIEGLLIVRKIASVTLLDNTSVKLKNGMNLKRI